MNPTEAKSFIWTVLFCIVVVCVVAVLMSFPAKANAQTTVLGGMGSYNTNLAASVHVQEFQIATTTRIEGISFPNGDGGNLSICKGEIIDASTVDDILNFVHCIPGNSMMIDYGYHVCHATSTIGNFCAANIVLQAETKYYFVYYQDDYENSGILENWPVHQWLKDGSPADPYPNNESCWVQTDYNAPTLGDNRGACSFYDLDWFEQYDGDMTFAVWYDPNDNTPLYNASDIFGNLNANMMADATCMPTHCYRNDTCYLDVLYNDLADGSDFYTGWDEFLQDGVTPDNMSYSGKLTSDDYGATWDQPNLHYIQFAIMSANQGFGTSTAMDGRIITKRVCDYVDANSDWYGEGNGDPDMLDTMGCDCEITYHNEEGSYMSNLFYQTITPQECASSTVGSCGLTDVECGLKKAANWVICPEEDKVVEFYSKVQERQNQFPYNFVSGVTGGLTELRATTTASIPLMRIGKNGVREADAYLITPERWLDPSLDEFRYWYFKIIRWMMAVLFMVYFFNRLFNMITGGTKTVAEDEINRNKPVQKKVDPKSIYAVGANRYK